MREEHWAAYLDCVGELLVSQPVQAMKEIRHHKQCFAHPLAAERNARALCGELSREEENGILAHMWPMARSAPRSRTAAAVCVADKLCATAEVLGIWRRTALYRMACLPRPAFGGNAVKKR